ncbi:MAG: hypothetical protein IJ480_00335 [Clostridia bacterium]|nr:hypothetical protein [Clostridia bacterium]
MQIAGRCRGCGEMVAEGEFCYWIGQAFWCRGCVERAAVIAGSGRKNAVGLRFCRERRTGGFREREIVTENITDNGKGGRGICRRNR